MRAKAIVGLAVAAASIAFVAASAQAQNPPSGARHPTLVPHMRHMPHTMGQTAPRTGGIVGDKHTKVYHMPGDRGQLPAEKNRVYFRTEAEARAAGYHRAGGGHAMKPMRRMPARDTKTGRFVKTRR